MQKKIDNQTLPFSFSNFSTMLKQVWQMSNESLCSPRSLRYSISIVTSPNLDLPNGERFKLFDLEEELSMFEFLNEHPHYEAECDLYYTESDESSWERSEIGVRMNNEQLTIYY